MNAEKERKRAKQFTETEKEILLALVSAQVSIVESKKTDSRTIVTKKITWDSITEEFNKNPEINRRTSDQLKKCWENLKSRAKTDIATEKRERRATGGGTMPSQEISNSSISSQIIGLIPSQMRPLQNDFDEDADYHYGNGKFLKYRIVLKAIY